jgi:Helicase conserved C-terminal domain
MSRLVLRTLLKAASEDVVHEVGLSWLGADGLAKVQGRAAVIAAVAAAMETEERALARIEALPRKLQDLLEPFLQAPLFACPVAELFGAQSRNFKSRYDLEACLAALHREGMLFPAADKKWTGFDGPGYALPEELAQCIAAHRQRSRRALKDVLTLQGHLDARYFRQRAANGAAASAADKQAEHARKIYKLYSMESSIAARRQKLPAHIGAVVTASLLHHGGISTWADLQHEFDAEDLPDPELLRKCLEEAMLGTAGPLALARFGIQPAEEALIIFHEVALAELRRHGAAHPPQVAETLSCGGNLATNVGRFLRELQQSKVQFTADGELFKASQKRIASLLLPVPGGFLPAETQLELLYRFCLQRRLIDRRGERGLRPTPAGMEFDRSPLADQIKLLLQHVLEDRTLPGEAFHQVRLRRVFLRMLRRAEPMHWQELTILPFLARNAYLAQLDGAQAEEFFAARFQGGGYTPTETLQQMAWNLVLWVKRRLFPLGIVDIGMKAGRPVGLRLSQFGAGLLDADPAGKVAGTRSTVIVNPDFEVLLFPGDDVHEAVHAIDRFSRRLKSDHVHQFKLDEASVRAGIAEGLTCEQILHELTDRARVPVPQNVLYSLEEWAGRG